MTASLLQPAYGDHQVGTLEDFHQLVEDLLVVVWAGLKVLLQYALCFADGLKSQLLISHRFLPFQFA